MTSSSKTKLKLKVGFLGFDSSSMENLVKVIEDASMVTVDPILWRTDDLEISDLLSRVSIVIISSFVDAAELELWLQTIRRHDSSIPILIIIEGPLEENLKNIVKDNDCLIVSDNQPCDLVVPEIGDVLASAFILKSLMENFDSVSSWGIWGGLHC